MVGRKLLHWFEILSLRFTQRNHSRFGAAWASLALDHLSVMASAVSSERAFSAGGITISKLRNRLKGDIVEGLQVLKAGMKKGIFRSDYQPTSATDAREEEEAMLEAALLDSLGDDAGGISSIIDLLDNDCFDGDNILDVNQS